MAEVRKKIEIRNKKALFNYSVEMSFEAGIVLAGTEVKSIRNNAANFGDAYCYFADNELFIKNMQISPWKQASYNNHEPLAERKLLLRKAELKKIEAKSKEKGYTIFPIRLFETDRGFFKLEIGLGKGKKMFDKRDDIKERDAKREMERIR